MRIGSIVLFGGLLLTAMPAFSAEPAKLEAGEHVLKKGETAEFKIASSAATSSELHAWCEVAAGGNASLMFDGDHYIPLSEPTVGDTISLAAGENRRYELEGTVEANKGDAYIAFAFTGAPTSMCFPGMQCDGAAAGAQEVKVACGNNK
ncbi:MAG TPA: hypothetical protein VGN05_14020 [Parvibaculum sp.]|jgi:hypothetical protein